MSTKKAHPCLFVRGGTVIDGNGRPGFTADPRIKNGVIVGVGRLSPKSS